MACKRYKINFEIDKMSDEMILIELLSRHKNKIDKAPIKTERLVPHKSLIIGIGDAHTAEIILANDAYDALFAVEWEGEE